MVWQTKLSLVELLRRRRRTPEQWAVSNKFTTLDEVLDWCVKNNAEVDVNVFKFLKAKAPAPKADRFGGLPPNEQDNKKNSKKPLKDKAPSFLGNESSEVVPTKETK